MQILVIIILLLAIAGLAYLSLGAGAGLIGYSLLKAKGGATPAYKPTAGGWSFVYSPGMTGDASHFTFPNADGVHYITTKAAGLALGKTITLRFNLSGDGALAVADPADIPPATVRLFIWGQGVNDRWWIRAATNLVDGDQTVSAVIDPANWGGVGGNPVVVQAPFESVISNPYAMGFTLGGQYFAGHGVYCPVGSKTFTLLEYSVA